MCNFGSLFFTINLSPFRMARTRGEKRQPLLSRIFSPCCADPLDRRLFDEDNDIPKTTVQTDKIGLVRKGLAAIILIFGNVDWSQIRRDIGELNLSCNRSRVSSG